MVGSSQRISHRHAAPPSHPRSSEKSNIAYSSNVKPYAEMTEAEKKAFIHMFKVDPEKWTKGLDRMPRSERGDRRGKKAV